MLCCTAVLHRLDCTRSAGSASVTALGQLLDWSGCSRRDVLLSSRRSRRSHDRTPSDHATTVNDYARKLKCTKATWAPAAPLQHRTCHQRTDAQGTPPPSLHQRVPSAPLLQSRRKRRPLTPPRPVKFEAPLHEINDEEQLALAVPRVVLFRRRRDLAARVRRVLDEEGRVERFDERVEVGVRRGLEGGDAGDEAPVCVARELVNRGGGEGGDVLWPAAQRSIFLRPKMAAISMRASVSSFELKKGNRRVRKQRSMIPADQMSSAASSSRVSFWSIGDEGRGRTDGLVGTLEEDLGSPEASSSSAVRSYAWPAK